MITNVSKKEWLYANIAMIAYAVFVGFSFMSNKIMLTVSSNSLISLTWRFTVALLAASILVIIKAIPQGIKVKVSFPFIITISMYVAFMGFQALGLLFTTSIISGIMFAMIPIFARIISGFVLKEGSTLKQNLFASLSVCSVVGMFVIGGIGTFTSINPLGFFLLLFSSLCLATSNVFMRYVKKDYSPLTISFYNCVFGFVIFWLFTIVWACSNGRWQDVIEPLYNQSFLISILYLGVICTLGTGFLSSYGMRYMSAMAGTIYGNLSTAISVLAGAFVMHEHLYTYQVVCTILIIVGVVGMIRSQKQII